MPEVKATPRIPRSIWMLGFVSLLKLLGAGLVLLVAADLVLALAQGLPAVVAGVALWGLHLGVTQSVLATMVAATAPAHLRGTAFGIFSLACGGLISVKKSPSGVR